MKAGFSRARITPPLGTTMAGFGGRDRDHGCESTHDDLFVRACYVEHEGEAALILAYDLLFFTRGEGDRFKGAIGRHLDLLPRQILLNTSHTHCGPALGSWSYQDYTHPPDKLYVDDVERASVAAAKAAFAAARPVTLWAGATLKRRLCAGTSRSNNAFAWTIVFTRARRISFTQRSCAVPKDRSTRPFACGLRALISSMSSSRKARENCVSPA